MKKVLMVVGIVVLCIASVWGLCACSYGESKTKSNNHTQINESFVEPPPKPDFEALQMDWAEWEKEWELAFEQINSRHTYVITYSVELQYNHSVGNEWDYGLSYNNSYIRSGSKIIVPDSPATVTLTAFANESDVYTDYGSTLITFDSLEIGQKQSKWATVIVRENNGRYTGNTAKWYFEITIERV